jgi:NAD(P)-dependent dehydrogenase (short-subunit alcohol dehydrogenase family)
MTLPGTQVAGAVTVVTGGGSGIGRALSRRFAAEGAKAIVVADLNADAAQAVAAELPVDSLGIGLDVTDETAVIAALDQIEQRFGPIDIYCSNAGVGGAAGLGTNEQWDRAYRVHVLAHVYIARHLVPRMVARGSGHVMITASAAGLLTEMDTAPYSATKHGSVALAEWLAITQGGQTGVSFSCLCPQGVRTAMTAGFHEGNAVVEAGGFLEPEEVAEAVVTTIADGRFLVLPHPEVAEYERRRAVDRDRWLGGMRRVWAKLHPIGK